MALCRVYKKANENIDHIVSECIKLAQTMHQGRLIKWQLQYIDAWQRNLDSHLVINSTNISKANC